MTVERNDDTWNADRVAAWSSLATVLEWLPAALDAQLQQDAGLTHFEFGVLYALADAPDRALRMSVLASYSRSTLSRLSRAATRLEGRGLMRREPDREDGRYTVGILTGDGLAVVRAALPGHRALVDRLVFDSLTAPQTRQLGAIAGRIAERIDRDARWRAAESRTEGSDDVD